MITRSRVSYVVGNEYREKGQKWNLYADVYIGNPRVVDRVEFEFPGSWSPGKIVCDSPKPIKHDDGSLCWRFATNQKSKQPVNSLIQIFFADGNTTTAKHKIVREVGGSRSKFQRFRPYVPIPEDQRYGIELELTTLLDISRLREIVRAETSIFDEGEWRLHHDGSIVCNRSQPDCNTFELVSPILNGQSGLDRIRKMLDHLRQNNVDITVNKSMGFHIHVEVEGLNQEQRKRVCQNFVAFEDVFDSFVPKSRRSGSTESDQFFKSNRDALECSSNQERHSVLAKCRDFSSLAHRMNPGPAHRARYYKLNLQNLLTGKQPTMEFRQHSATIDFTKISNWVRLCVHLVRNSAYSEPKWFRDNRSLDFLTERLFQFVIKDRALKDYYLNRQNEINHLAEHCCDGCRDGQMCTQIVPRNNGYK